MIKVKYERRKNISTVQTFTAEMRHKSYFTITSKFRYSFRVRTWHDYPFRLIIAHGTLPLS